MPYTLVDCLGLLLAAVITGPLLLLPGLAIARWSGLLGRLQPPNISQPGTSPAMAWALALVAAYGALPLIDSLSARLLGLDAALMLHLGLAAAGLAVVRGSGTSLAPSRTAVAVLALWLVVVAWATVDLDWNGALNQSLLAKDMIKHAATVRSLVDQGHAPPADVFYLREALAGYYYYYYVLSALVERLAFGLVDSRAAIGGQIAWTGAALVALLHVLLAQLTGRARRGAGAIVIAIAAAAGIEVLTVLLIGAAGGIWYAQVSWWKEGVGAFVHSTLWVPHHLAAIIATWAGLLALVRAGAAIPPATAGGEGWDTRAALYGRLRDEWRLIALAGACFASALGLSVWVTMGAVAVVGLWLAWLAAERRWVAVAAVLGAGAVSVLLSVPHLMDLLANRAYDGTPVAVELRGFPFDDAVSGSPLAQAVARLVWLPLNILLGFGVTLVGSIVYWRRHGRGAASGREIGLLLMLAAVVGLAMSSLVKSTIVNNDLGWRVLLLAQVSALVWTAAVLAPLLRLARRRMSLGQGAPRLAGVLAALMAVGWLGTAYELVGLRGSVALGMRGLPRTGDHQVIDHDIRGAYAFANGRIGRGSVVQHNPDARYLLGFGLYGRNPVAVAPRNLGSLFGASRADVEARLADISPVFLQALEATETRARLERNRVDVVLVTAADPVWHQPRSWVWTAPALYAAGTVRLVETRSISDNEKQAHVR